MSENDFHGRFFYGAISLNVMAMATATPIAVT